MRVLRVWKRKDRHDGDRRATEPADDERRGAELSGGHSYLRLRRCGATAGPHHSAMPKPAPSAISFALRLVAATLPERWAPSSDSVSRAPARGPIENQSEPRRRSSLTGTLSAPFREPSKMRSATTRSVRAAIPSSAPSNSSRTRVAKLGLRFVLFLRSCSSREQRDASGDRAACQPSRQRRIEGHIRRTCSRRRPAAARRAWAQQGQSCENEWCSSRPRKACARRTICGHFNAVTSPIASSSASKRRARNHCRRSPAATHTE